MRVNQISRILAVKKHGPVGPDPGPDPPLRVVRWSSLLRSCSASEAYLREQQDAFDPEGVVRHLVLDDAFPRAMRFGVMRALESLREIRGGEDRSFGLDAERQLGRLESQLRSLDPREILARGLPCFLSGVQDDCNQVGAEIHRAFSFT